MYYVVDHSVGMLTSLCAMRAMRSQAKSSVRIAEVLSPKGKNCLSIKSIFFNSVLNGISKYDLVIDRKDAITTLALDSF